MLRRLTQAHTHTHARTHTHTHTHIHTHTHTHIHTHTSTRALPLAHAGYVVEETGDGLDYEGGEGPPALELEDSQELKRSIFPADVVQVRVRVRVCVGCGCVRTCGCGGHSPGSECGVCGCVRVAVWVYGS